MQTARKNQAAQDEAGLLPRWGPTGTVCIRRFRRALLMNRTGLRILGRAMHRPALMPLLGFALKLGLGEMAETLLLRGQKVMPARALATGYVFRYPSLDQAFGQIFHGLI